MSLFGRKKKENHNGEAMSERQKQILEALTRGLSNPDIATMMGTTPENIRDHLKVVFAKIGAANRAEAVSIALRKNLLNA